MWKTLTLDVILANLRWKYLIKQNFKGSKILRSNNAVESIVKSEKLPK